MLAKICHVEHGLRSYLAAAAAGFAAGGGGGGGAGGATADRSRQ